MAHVLPSSLEEYQSPGALGAYVTVVADAEDEEAFVDKVRSTLESTMMFPVLEIKNIEILTPDRKLVEELQYSIENILPVFPIAFSSFYFYTSDD